MKKKKSRPDADGGSSICIHQHGFGWHAVSYNITTKTQIIVTTTFSTATHFSKTRKDPPGKEDIRF
jgi:hypothetical protein